MWRALLPLPLPLPPLLVPRVWGLQLPVTVSGLTLLRVLQLQTTAPLAPSLVAPRIGGMFLPSQASTFVRRLPHLPTCRVPPWRHPLQPHQSSLALGMVGGPPLRPVRVAMRNPTASPLRPLACRRPRLPWRSLAILIMSLGSSRGSRPDGPTGFATGERCPWMAGVPTLSTETPASCSAAVVAAVGVAGVAWDVVVAVVAGVPVVVAAAVATDGVPRVGVAVVAG